MNILFIYSSNIATSSSKPLDTPQLAQLGISYISSFLKEHGHQTKLLVLSRVSGIQNRNTIDLCLKGFSPKLICFTMVSTEYQFVADIARYVKTSYPDIYLLVGGPHASLAPNKVMSGDFDALCLGEGEHPVLELVSQLERGIVPSGIPNLWIKHGSEIEENPPRPFLQDLDSLPFPDREMWQDWIQELPESRYSVLLGRGCPFQCTYCCNHIFRKLASGNYVRFRSPDNIVKEIKELASRYPEKEEFYLEVETFSVNKEWAIGLCSKLEQFNKTLSRPLSFGVNLRIMPNADLESLFAACKKSNFRVVNIGLESGSERVRREILKRNYSNEDIISAVTLARKYGLKVALFNMIGIPGETIADFKETVRINRICQPDYHLTSIFFPYPGTDLYFLCEEQALLKEPLDTELERFKATLDLPEFTKKQIQRSYIWFDYYLFKGRLPMYKILARVLKSELASKPYMNVILRKLSRVGFLKQSKWFRCS